MMDSGINITVHGVFGMVFHEVVKEHVLEDEGLNGVKGQMLEVVDVIMEIEMKMQVVDLIVDIMLIEQTQAVGLTIIIKLLMLTGIRHSSKSGWKQSVCIKL